MKTAIGGFITATILTFTLGYFVSKMQALINRSDPIISKETVSDYYDVDNGLNL